MKIGKLDALLFQYLRNVHAAGWCRVLLVGCGEILSLCVFWPR